MAVNGHSLGNLGHQEHPHQRRRWTWAEVHATINDDNTIYEGDSAALRVSFNYRFTRTAGSDAVAIRDFTLYADGTFYEEPRWTQKPDGWWGATEQRFGSAAGGAAAVAGEAIGPLIEWLKESFGDDITADLPTLKGWIDPNGGIIRRINPPGADGLVMPSRRSRRKRYRWTPGSSEGPWGAICLSPWDYDGTSIGEILVRLTNPNDPIGGSMHIKGHEPSMSVEPNAAGIPSVRVSLPFTYNYSFSFSSPEYRNFDVVLYADGKYEKVSY